MKRLTQRQTTWILIIALCEVIFFVSISRWISNPTISTMAVRVGLAVGGLLFAPILFSSSTKAK